MSPSATHEYNNLLNIFKRRTVRKKTTIMQRCLCINKLCSFRYNWFHTSETITPLFELYEIKYLIHWIKSVNKIAIKLVLVQFKNDKENLSVRTCDKTNLLIDTTNVTNCLQMMFICICVFD